MSKPRYIDCGTCWGEGYFEDDEGNVEDCWECEGTGEILVEGDED